MISTHHAISLSHSKAIRFAKKPFRRIGSLTLAAYFIPWVLCLYIVCGLLDVLRRRQRSWSNIDRYFAGNGVFTWLLSPFNLLIDLISLPYWNKGIYRLSELPKRYQAEIQALIDAVHQRDLMQVLEAKMDGKKRGMIFFQWYGKVFRTTVNIPEFQVRYRYIRTIGVSIFDKKQSTSKHFGPLRVTLRMLYNINTIASRNVYIEVGDHTHYWQDNKLFIFDDTLQHRSCNESDAVRYCLFVDILRPSLVPRVLSGILTAIRLVMAPIRRVFYHRWTVIK